MPERKDTEGGRRKMTTAIKPIRPTELEFESKAEMQEFISYATSRKKTENDPGLDRLRRLLKDHKPVPERK